MTTAPQPTYQHDLYDQHDPYGTTNDDRRN